MPGNVKVSDLKPSAQQLFILLGREDWIREGVRTNEYPHLRQCATEIRKRISKTIESKVFYDTAQPWPIEPEIADAFRCCMHDYPNSIISWEFSRLLQRCGFDDPEVIAASEFKPSAQRLYILLGHENWINRRIPADRYSDIFDIGSRSTEIQNRVYKAIGKEAYSDTTKPWSIEPQLADAFRCCMRDYPNSFISWEFSWLLLRCGLNDPEVIANLGWQAKMAFSWKTRGITVDRIRSLLARAGMSNDIQEKTRNKLESWIEHPVSAALSSYIEVFDAIFGRRCFDFFLESDCCKIEADLFREFFSRLDLETQITDVDECFEGSTPYQSIRETDSETWQTFYEEVTPFVTFRLDGVNYVFFVPNKEGSSHCEDMAVLSNFDALMQRLGRKERAFLTDAQNSGDFAYYIVGDSQGLRELADELGIEILSASPEAQSLIDFGMGNPPVPYCAQPTLHTIP